ncbi:MAG: hypothetical protein K2W88_15095 [Pararheinheimera sp.]|nr:hypothetical protein [Rheinheimera sp.]
MATPAYIKARIGEGLIKCVRLHKYNDGYSCQFEYHEKGKKALYPSTGKQPQRIWLTYKDVLDYVKEQIGWTGPMFDQNFNQIQ